MTIDAKPGTLGWLADRLRDGTLIAELRALAVLTGRAEKVRSAIDRAGDRGLSRTEVSDLLGANLRAVELDAVMREVMADGRYDAARFPTRGRPVTMYRRASGTTKGHGRGKGDG